MSTSQVYGACLTKSSRRRGRPLDPRLIDLDAKLVSLARQYQPVGIRGLFYRAESRGLIPKEEKTYDLIGRELLKLRRSGDIPYSWIVDDSREVYGRRSFRSWRTGRRVAGLYRRDYWRHSPTWVQVWVEKRTLKGIVAPIVIDKWGLN